MLEKRLNALIAAYDKLVLEIDAEAVESSDRAYGGIIRAGKGCLVESLSTELVRIAWEEVLKQESNRLNVDKKKIPVQIKEGYIDRIKNEKVKEYVVKNQASLVYKFGTDVHVYIDGELVLPIECKAFTENAMMKRILFDASLMKETKGIDKYYLIQLESQLGGDYSQLNEVTYGSAATHALLSHVDVDLEIITLLSGERQVDKPIHKLEFYKPLTMDSLKKVVELFANDLKIYAR